MPNLIKSALLALVALSATSLLAAPLQLESSLPVGQSLSGKTRVKAQADDSYSLTLQGQSVQIRGLGATPRLPRQAAQLHFERRAHPAGPQSWLTLTQGAQSWLLASNLTGGATLAAGRQLVWQAERVQLSNGQGQLQTLPADDDLGVKNGWRECLRLLDVRLPAAETSDSEAQFDIAYWNTRAKDCR
ncbi:hypothetical protein ABHF33_07535 [Chitinibacter sp. FCG-7]|uniref:Uncharacterized protein n=1 Tax=Chitinibacter mangrovi TaxID=3153927 RepID=A0AAU7FD30_9NEIS